MGDTKSWIIFMLGGVFGVGLTLALVGAAKPKVVPPQVVQVVLGKCEAGTGYATIPPDLPPAKVDIPPSTLKIWEPPSQNYREVK